jgi:hypothetical protein
MVAIACWAPAAASPYYLFDDHAVGIDQLFRVWVMARAGCSGYRPLPAWRPREIGGVFLIKGAHFG